MGKPVYFTTPIYYVNGRPHIGHAYSTVATDVLARYARARGSETYFLTGTDEHGQKIDRLAKDQGVSPQDAVDRLIPTFKACWDLLGCEIDDFIRTTESRHQLVAQDLWRRCVKSGDIELGEYEGWYSVADEAFYTEKELVDGKAPTGRPVEKIKEPSYFFRLSRYTDKLLKFYDEHPNFVEPEGRYNEVKSFVREGLRDLSVSRTSFKWGVPVPDAPEHVMYVWFDALSNYVSALGGPGAAKFEHFWPPNGQATHIIGKEILRFHAVYWPAFLMSAGLPLPTQVWSHGWMTVNGQKMSKSDGNFLLPEPAVAAVGADPLRYYLMREIGFGQDGDFSAQNVVARYHGDLGNGLGNLLQRMLSGIVMKYFDATVPATEAYLPIDLELIAHAKRLSQLAQEHMEKKAPHKALEGIFELCGHANRYVDSTEPWNLAKKGELGRLGTVAYNVLETCRWMSIMLWPVMPQKMTALRQQLGLGPLRPTVNLDLWPSVWGGLMSGTKLQAGPSLFPRFDEKILPEILTGLGQPAVPFEPQKKSSKSKTPMDHVPSESGNKPNAASLTAAAPTALAAPDNVAVIGIEDLSKVDLRLGKVLTATRVPKSDKLLELSVDIAEAEPRTILAGIGLYYDPENLVGRQLIVVANLPPRVMMGRTSQGMVLAVSDGQGLSVLSPDKTIATGVRAK